MTEAPQGFDFSFLNEEEVKKILQVLERNEELQRAEKDRISKLQKTKRDIRWLQGATGEWFEEIQRKKFCNETDVTQMLKPPLTYRLRKERSENDPMELQTSRSKKLTNPKPSVSPRMSFRSSLASLFSFRRSGKELSKLQSQRQKGCDGRGGSPVPMRGPTVTKTYNSAVGNQPIASAFVPKPVIMREESGIPPPWDASMLEDEFFQVLDDLDSKLAQEQSASPVRTRMPLNYGPRTQFNHSYSSENRRGHITGRHKNHCNETSNLSIYDILRPGTPREGFKTFSPRTKTIYDMYRSREPRVVKEDSLHKNTFGSTSLCFDGRQRTVSPATGRFTVRSLHFPATTQNKSSFTPVSRQQSPKRTPLSSIIWNRSDSSRERQKKEEFLGAPSPMDIDPDDQYVYPQCFRERRYELYHSQNAFQNVPLNDPMGDVMIPDTLENSENMPFYHQDNAFARSFLSDAFRQNREQRFEQSSFWSQQEEHFSWSDFPQSRKPFTSSDRDFEMISVETNSTASVQGHGVPSQHWGPFSPGYGKYVFRGQGEPHRWRPDFHTSPLERMDTPHVNENQSPPHFGTLDVFSMTASSCPIQAAGLECQQGGSPAEVATNERPCSCASAQPLAPSFRASFPPIPHDRGSSQSPNFQSATVTLQETAPNKPDSFPIRSCTEVTMVNSDSTESPSHMETQTNIQVIEMNTEKDMSGFISEGKQRNKVNQTNKTGRIPQPVLQTAICNSLPDFQNPHSQDSAQNDRFGFNAPAIVSSKRSPSVFPRKDTSEIYITQRDKVNELNKGKCFPGNRKLDSETSLPFLPESRTLVSFPSPDRGSHQESTVHNEDNWSIINNKHWCSEPIANQETQSPKREGDPVTQSANCSRPGTGHSISQDSLGLSSNVPPNSSPSNSSFHDVDSSTLAFSRNSSDKELSLEVRGEKDNANQNRKNQFSVNPSENQESEDSSVPRGDEVTDGAQCQPYSPFRSGRRGVRRRVSCIEKLSKMENRLSPTNVGNSSIEDPSQARASELSTVYCTLPRKSDSFLTQSRQSESKIRAASIRNGPLPFQIKTKVDASVGKCASNKPSPSPPESVSEYDQVASDLVTGTPEAAKRMTGVKAIRSASVRKGPLPFLIKRAMSCPSGEPCASTERHEREKSLVPDTDASAATTRSWERIFNPAKSDSALREFTLAKRHHQKEFDQECTQKDVETTAPRVSSFTLSKEDPVPIPAEVSGKETKKALHKFKTTSMFSVSGDEENIKCLEVVSIYYTLPRKPSKKFCSLLQKFAQDTDPLRKPFQAEMETFPKALEKEILNCPTQEKPGIPSPEDLKMQVDSVPGCLSHTTENLVVSHLPSSEPSESTLEEMAPAGPDVALHKGEPKTRETIPDNLVKTPLGDSQRKKGGGKLSSPVLQTPLMLQEKDAREEKSKSSQQPANRVNSAPSDCPAHSESNVEKRQTRRSAGPGASGTAISSTERGRCTWSDHTAIVDDHSSRSQPREATGTTGSDCQDLTEKMLSGSESQVSALTPALHKLQLAEDAGLGQAELQNVQSEPRELLQRSQERNATEISQVEDETQKLTWDQTLPLDGNNKNKTNLDDLEKRDDRYSVNHRVAAMSKASRKFPAKDLSPRRHVATIFPQSESRPGFGRLSVCRLECNPLSPEPIPKSTGSTDESSFINHRVSVDKSENLLQVSPISNREPSTHPFHQKFDNISQLHQNEFHSVPESPEHENSKDTTVAQILEVESETPVQLTLTSPREESSDDQRGLSPPLPLEPAQESTMNLPLTRRQLQHKSVSSPEWEPEPHLYRSKSLKNIHVHGDLFCTNHPPKVRGRHFSESTSIDNALSQLSLREDFPDNSGYGRKFKSFSELSSSDERESWALPSNSKRKGPRSTSSISRPIDYGIFGKEQQLAFLENVKRSLTQGRLWKPSFLKNPGFLKDDVLNSSNSSQSELLNSPSSQVPEGSLFTNEPLNIYEEGPVDSDWDTDTTTDDEYYLDENDKESEL